MGAAMRAHPWWVAGTGRDVVRFAAAVPGLVAKDGAEGVFVAAVPDGRTVVVKILDGSPRPVATVVAAVLRALGVDEPALEAAGRTPVLGHGVAVGSVEPLVALPADARSRAGLWLRPPGAPPRADGAPGHNRRVQTDERPSGTTAVTSPDAREATTPPRAPVRRRLRLDAVTRALAPAAVYLAVRLVGVGVLGLMAGGAAGS